MGPWTWRGIALTDGWFGVPAGNFYSWLFVTLAFSSLSRWLRHAAAGRPALEWLQLAVPLPAFGILLTSIVPFAVLHPIVDPSPGGGMVLFLVVMAAFLGISAWGVWGPDRIRPDGEGLAILDLGLALGTRVAIHGFFIAALVLIGAAVKLPVLLIAALILLAAEWPLGRLVHARHTAAHAVARRAIAEGSAAPAEVYR
jgi:hypothetical protein